MPTEIFDATDPDVLSGKYDTFGYTPQERRAQARKEQQPMAKPKPDTTKPRPAARRKNWSASRVNTLPSNGGQPESQEVAPEKIPIGEAMRRAVEALGDITVDDAVAGGQLRQLGELYENVAREQAAFDRRSEDAKLAKKSLESAQALLLDQVKMFTHAAALPLFDRQQAERDHQDMIDAAQEATVAS